MKKVEKWLLAIGANAWWIKKNKLYEMSKQYDKMYLRKGQHWWELTKGPFQSLFSKGLRMFLDGWWESFFFIHLNLPLPTVCCLLMYMFCMLIFLHFNRILGRMVHCLIRLICARPKCKAWWARIILSLWIKLV